MRLRWSEAARSDFVRLEHFLRSVNELAAARAVQAIVAAPERLLTLPRLGSSVEGYEPREVRRLLVGPYELRYEVFDAEVVVLRVWHAREER